MSTVTFKLTEAFQDAAGLPILAPSLGVANPVARWSAHHLTENDGTVISAWRSIMSDHVLVGQATVASGGGGRYLLFDGTADCFRVTGLPTGVRTIGVLTRTTAGAAGSCVVAGPDAFWYNGTNFSVVGGSTPQYPSPARPASAWGWRFLTHDGTARVWATDGEAGVTQASAATSIGTAIQISRRWLSGDWAYYPGDVAEIVLYADALSQAQRAQIHAKLAARLPLWAA
ncbi:MAG: hypothetical protein LBS27_10900 [Bifidobacteriaceae bacterium]|jgi:hypothetical protein|nr:hypothetical protein [Bifidobacteriaceae bacterium]